MVKQVAAQSIQQSVSGKDSADKRAQKGEWDPTIINLVNVPVHAHVLPNKKVLYWGRRVDLHTGLHPHECTPLIWDPSKPIEQGKNPKATAQQPTDTTGNKVNLFCGGHAFLPNGGLLVAGGHKVDGDGINQACIYDYQKDTWTPLEPMNGGRWYPTVTTLADGTILVTGGSFFTSSLSFLSSEDSFDIETFSLNMVPQIWDNSKKKWKNVVLRDKYPFSLFPCVHVAPNGLVFLSGPTQKTFLLNTSTGAWSTGGVSRTSGTRDYAPSVMYDVGKVIYIGGGNDEKKLPTAGLPTNVAEVIDLNAPQPKWRKTNPMHYPRRQHNATILADGTVLVTGGTRGGGTANKQQGFNDIRPGAPVHVAELWDPATETWTELASETVDRCYHSTAVLLPDATVLSAGGGEYEDEENYKPRDEFNYPNGQVFNPPYLFRGNRPVIISAPDKIKYGEPFSLSVLKTPKIEKVTLVRLSSTTHTNNQNQRFNRLGITRTEEETKVNILTVAAPKRPEFCPPGHYMLFVISERKDGGDPTQAGGVPSEAKIIQIGSDVAASPTVVEPAPAEADLDTGLTAMTYVEELDQDVVRAGSTGRRVTVGLTPQCLYGLGPCWAGAYEALTELSGVAAVRPIANAKDSTAEVYLRDQGLPDLDDWPTEFAQAANGSYEFRGVEVTITGTVQQRNGAPHLTHSEPSFDVTLKPLDESGVKVQWDPEIRSPRPVTRDEFAAYQKVQDRTGKAKPVRVTGPLTKTPTEWILYVRVVGSVES